MPQEKQNTPEQAQDTTDKKASQKNIHAGHRSRMKSRFEKNQFEGFADHEILEVMLYFTNKTKNTNGIAHDLLDRFGSIDNVLRAEPDELVKIKGVGAETVFFFKALADFMRVHAMQASEGKALDSFESRREYFFSQLWMYSDEVFLLTCLDDRQRILSTSIVARGTPGSVKPPNRDIVRRVVNQHCNSVMIAHNHPVGSPMPSAEDVSATVEIARLLRELDVTLEDHIIVGDGKAVSMKQSGCFFT